MEGMVEWCFEKGNRMEISSSTITKKTHDGFCESHFVRQIMEQNMIQTWYY